MLSADGIADENCGGVDRLAAVEDFDACFGDGDSEGFLSVFLFFLPIVSNFEKCYTVIE